MASAGTKRLQFDADARLRDADFSNPTPALAGVIELADSSYCEEYRQSERDETDCHDWIHDRHHQCGNQQHGDKRPRGCGVDAVPRTRSPRFWWSHHRWREGRHSHNCNLYYISVAAFTGTAFCIECDSRS